MIRWFDSADLAAYRVKGDPLLAHLGDPRAAGCQSERWLLDSEAKRMIAWTVYAPSLSGRTLDVGAGTSSITLKLAEQHDYTVCELPDDWIELDPAKFDRVIAVDIFPNVDQRLAAFLERFWGLTLRLVLTTYPDRWYRARRLDGDEILTVKAWGWEQTARALAPYMELPYPPAESLFPNGRQVCLITT